MTCRKCRGTGKDAAAPAVTAKVPGQRRYKLVQPYCPACGGTGIRLEGHDVAQEADSMAQ